MKGCRLDFSYSGDEPVGGWGVLVDTVVYIRVS